MAKKPEPHPRYTPSEITRAAFLAGSGASAAEIAAALGGRATANRVCGLLHRHGLRLVAKTRGQVAFPLVVNEVTMEKLEAAAAGRGADPQALAAKLLEGLAGDGREFFRRVQIAYDERAEAAE